jgi:hypothetical protein
MIGADQGGKLGVIKSIRSQGTEATQSWQSGNNEPFVPGGTKGS